MDKTPGKLLTAYRERAGLSVVELAEKTGIKYTNISAMEHDTRNIGLSTAKRLGAALGVDYTKFL
jgi:transcriptional regulator with XRE-family HTH domain